MDSRANKNNPTWLHPLTLTIRWSFRTWMAILDLNFALCCPSGSSFVTLPLFTSTCRYPFGTLGHFDCCCWRMGEGGSSGNFEFDFSTFGEVWDCRRKNFDIAIIRHKRAAACVCLWEFHCEGFGSSIRSFLHRNRLRVLGLIGEEPCQFF